jgi:tetratricopeptide (TPR) repeat protein
MADLKEDTSVDANQVDETVERRKPVDPSLEGIQLYYEQNKKVITYVGAAFAILIAALVYYRFFYLPEQEKEAANEMFWAENYFQNDSFNIALKGGPTVFAAEGQKPMMGYEQIAENYNLTRSGNLANYYAGICYLRTGKYEQAIEFLDKYDGDDEIVAPIAIGAIGDCHMELNHIDDAIKYYSKAADKSNNSFTTPYYLKKTAFAHEQKGAYKEALETYQRIETEFSTSTEAQEISKYIARVKALGNLN